MDDLTSFSGILREFGPLGLSLILMGTGLVYLLRWLRSEQERAEKERKESHDKFTVTLEKQSERAERIMDNTVSKFTTALDRQVERIDVLSDRVDRLDDHVRGLP